MTILVCVDDRMGQMFHRRRLSRDRVLSARILERAAGRVLRISPYSVPLFDGLPSSARLEVGEDYLAQASGDDLCFVEREDAAPWLDRADRLVLYRWNRAYPADLRFPGDILAQNWTLTAASDFPGSSHDKITEEFYERP